MFDKNCLIFSSPALPSLGQLIVGSITAGDYQGTAQGFLRGTYGSCTSDQINELCDNADIGLPNENVQGFRLSLSSDLGGMYHALVMRFKIHINGVVRSGYCASTSSFDIVGDLVAEQWISQEPPAYLVYNKFIKESDNLSRRCMYIRPVEYPYVCTPEDFNIAKTQYENSGLCVSTTRVNVGDWLAFGGGYSVDVQKVGLKSGSKYDFTLEYKIDAIITADGVQTF